LVITISQDGKTAWTKWKLPEGKWSSPFQSPCQGSGDLIRWNVLAKGKETTGSHSFTLQFNDNRTATLSYHGLISAGKFAGFTADGSGVITKQ
jgi:hypothetical protein